ncbi:MAG: hypothetical protein Q8R02_18695 [Hyphomonadaceae bacterium]|nr:hypothetical protein [Hyphomonadaceae bacterium]
MLRLALLSLIALSLGAPTYAQTAPKGWKVDAGANSWTATSPEQVRLVFYPAVKSRSTFVYWFEDEGLRRTQGFGGTVRAQDPAERSMDPDAGAFLAQTRTIESANRVRTAVLSYAWETRQGRQLAQIVMPLALGTESPAYKAAFEQLTAAWKSGVAYAPPEASTPQPTPKPAG